MKRPLCIDLFCGLGGWTEGFLAEGWDVVGFDIERHDYGTGVYPAQLVLQDVLTLHGSQFRNADIIVASPPCQAYSYRAMPFKRCKALPPPSNELFEACFRIQREASEAAGKHIPLVVENVKGAQRWLGPVRDKFPQAFGKCSGQNPGQARYHYGSYYLWGDLPALMPRPGKAAFKKPGITFAQGWNNHPEVQERRAIDGRKNTGGSWFLVSHNKTGMNNPRNDPRDECYKGFARRFSDTPSARFSSRSDARKQAAAEIAKIPLTLSRHIARVYKP